MAFSKEYMAFRMIYLANYPEKAHAANLVGEHDQASSAGKFFRVGLPVQKENRMGVVSDIYFGKGTESNKVWYRVVYQDHECDSTLLDYEQIA